MANIIQKLAAISVTFTAMLVEYIVSPELEIRGAGATFPQKVYTAAFKVIGMYPYHIDNVFF